MAMKFNPLSGQFDLVGAGSSGTFALTEYDNIDPPAPSNGVPWIKRTVILDGTLGFYRGFGAFNYAGDGGSTYQLSVKTIDSGIKRVTIS